MQRLYKVNVIDRVKYNVYVADIIIPGVPVFYTYSTTVSVCLPNTPLNTSAISPSVA